MSTSMMEPSLVELVGSNLTKGILVFSRTSSEVATIALMDRVASSTRSPLLSQLSFGNCLRYWVVSLVASTVSSSWEHYVIAARIEKLCSHHHLLLLTCVRVWCFPLVHEIQQVCLVSSCILVADTTGRSNSIMAYTWCSCAKGTGSSGVPVMLSHHGHIVLVGLWRAEIVDGGCVPGIALS